jgi:hypothetical protein
MKADELGEEFMVTAEELDDVREAAMAHAKKWGRTDMETCAIFAEFVKQVLEQARVGRMKN